MCLSSHEYMGMGLCRSLLAWVKYVSFIRKGLRVFHSPVHVHVFVCTSLCVFSFTGVSAYISSHEILALHSHTLYSCFHPSSSSHSFPFLPMDTIHTHAVHGSFPHIHAIPTRWARCVLTQRMAPFLYVSGRWLGSSRSLRRLSWSPSTLTI